MKITSINCKHTVKNGEIAVNLDEEINQEIVNRLQKKYKSEIRIQKVQGEESTLTIKIDKNPNYWKESVVGREDIDLINTDLVNTKEALEKEESDRKDRRKNTLKEIAKKTGLSLDCEE